LPENQLQIGETASEWVDRHDVAVAGSVSVVRLKYSIVASSPGPPVGGARFAKAAGFTSQMRLKAEAKIVARFRHSTPAP
jgi:hypothetical protein